MENHITRNFKAIFVDSRFVSIVFSLIIVGLRLLMFAKNGLPESADLKYSGLWSSIEPVLNENPFASFLFSTLLILLISFLISELNIRFGVIRLRTSMPFYIPLLIFSVHPGFLRLTPDIVALVFVLWSLYPLFAAYQFQRPHRYAFQFSALLAIGSLFQIYTLLYLPIWLIALKALDKINFRSLFASLFGLIIVFWIVFSSYVFSDNIAGFIEPFKQLVIIYDFRYMPMFSVPQWGFIGTLILLVAIYLIADSRQIVRERSFTKKILIFNLFVVLFSFLMQALYFTHTLFYLFVGIAFLSMVVSHFYTNSTRRAQVYSFFAIVGLLLLYYGVNLLTDFSPF